MGSRDASREAFEKGLVEDGYLWMKMITSRNDSVHSYNTETIKKIMDLIDNEFFEAFEQLEGKMRMLSGEQ